MDAPSPDTIEETRPDPRRCPRAAELPPEGNVKLRNYRLVTEALRVYSPTGDVRASLVPRFEPTSTGAPPRARLLELMHAGDPGRDALEAIVRPNPRPRRALARPLDEDARRFLERALLPPSPSDFSANATPDLSVSPALDLAPFPLNVRVSPARPLRTPKSTTLKVERSLADELRQADENGRSEDSNDASIREFRESVEREWLGKLALAVEEEGDDDEIGDGTMADAARRLDALLAESRGLHAELAGIHADLQKACQRAGQCAAAARQLRGEARALHYLDDVLALLEGDLATAHAPKGWPFALGAPSTKRNYIV